MSHPGWTLERTANAVVIAASVLVLFILWPLTTSLVARWRYELMVQMGPVPFSGIAEFALVEGRVMVSLFAVAATAVGVSGLASNRAGVGAPALMACVLIVAFVLWSLAVSTIW
jgi:hypothetical protein